MNPFEFVLALVAVIGLFKLIRDREARRTAVSAAGTTDQAELLAEVVRLRGRVEVLERAITSRSTRLSDEIEELRR